MKKLIWPAICVALAVTLILSLKECRAWKRKAVALKSSDSLNNQIIAYYVSENGDLHATAQTSEIEKNAFMFKYHDTLEKMAKQIKSPLHSGTIKPKQIEGIEHVEATTINGYTVDLQPVAGDSTKKEAYHSDSFSHSHIEQDGNKITVNDTTIVPIDITPYYDYPHYLFGVIPYGKIQHFTDVATTNPKAKITGYSLVRIKQREPGRWTIGPFVGVTVNGTVVWGAGIMWGAIRF